MAERAELEEIGHCGGKVTFDVAVDDHGALSFSVGYTHSRPTPAAQVAVWAIPQGVAVSDLHIRGLGAASNPPPIPGCFPVIISSDSSGMFGHQCPACGGYWRDAGGTNVCAYCAWHGGSRHQFLTSAQQRYVMAYCQRLNDALQDGKVGQHTIDLDAVADATRTDEKPEFYYAEEQQQNLFKCDACGERNDVLARIIREGLRTGREGG